MNTKLEILPRSVARPPVAQPASPYRPDYKGRKWVDAELPDDHRRWVARDADLVVIPGAAEIERVTHAEIERYVTGRAWVWPSRPIHFLCDQHADADAFFASLVATGGIAKTGSSDEAFELTAAGRAATFVIGGDCIDKGPSNLRLLRSLKALIGQGADVRLLAGNHDLRLYVGLYYADRRDDPRYAHLLARLGKKAAPLFREVYDAYLRGRRLPKVTNAEARRRLFPPESWYDAFPKAVSASMAEKKALKETKRIREKCAELEHRAAELGLTLSDVWHAVQKCRELFLEPGGEFAWFFERMELAMRAGSFLLVHAGIDDEIAAAIRKDGTEGINARFRQLLESDPFELYNGAVGNVFRTKYRHNNLPLTERGVADMYASSLYAIIHGHRNTLRGQRMVIRAGLLNFECDASVDRNTRAVEGLPGPGAAVTILRPEGRILGISTDFPHIKLFDPSDYGGATTIV